MAYYNNRSNNCGCQNYSNRPARPMPCRQPSGNMPSECDMSDMDRREKHSKGYGVDKMPLAMSYVPWQTFGELYPPCKALSEGTAFPELNQIFCGVRG